MGGQKDGPALERVWVIPHNELEKDLPLREMITSTIKE